MCKNQTLYLLLPDSSSGNYIKFPESNLRELPEFSSGKFPELRPLNSTEYYRVIINGFKVSTALHQTYNPIHIRRASSVIYT